MIDMKFVGTGPIGGVVFARDCGEFYWNLGKDISEKYPGKRRDANFFYKLSMDLQRTIPDATGLSVSNIKYARYFFELYSEISYRPQVVDDNGHDAHRVLAKFHLEKLGVPMGVADYQIKKLLPTQAQLAKCYADAEKQIEAARRRGNY